MNTVDQRILIPAPPEVVWNYLSSLENNPQWQANCRTVAFVSSIHRGQGTRWRHTNNRGRDVLIEVTAWYERAGYAYRIVDGSPYSQNSGSIRLQEIAEGTIVQWTFEYEISGFFSGFRNAVSVRRNVENEIIESLENLWRQANKLKNAADDFTAKSLMREAPDVESRANYQPRHPSKLKERLDDIIESDTDISLQAVEDANREPEPTEIKLPSIEQQILSEPNINTSTLEQITPIDIPEPEPDFLQDVDKPVEIPPVSVDEQPITKVEDRWMRPQEEEEFKLPELVEESKPDLVPAVEEKPTPIQDTQPDEIIPGSSSNMSVFELFGLPKPSETQQMRAVSAEDLQVTPPHIEPVKAVEQQIMPIITPEPQAGRIGMRVILRRRLIKIKRP